MALYKKVLVALSLNPESDHPLIERAKALTADASTKLYLLHAVEHLSSYGAAYSISAGLDVEEIMLKEAKKSIRKVASLLDIPDTHQIITIGAAKQVILVQAEKLKVDLILMGSHGRHGIQLLLGSTANAVLHGAKCDVLAARIRK